MLLSILERLGTLDALRACLVSKRMLNLPAMLSHIDIALGSRNLYQMNDVVADVIDKMLRRTPQVPIRRLKARFILRPRDCVSIGRSFAFAMATKKLDAAQFEILAPDTSHCWSNLDHFLNYYGTRLNTFVARVPRRVCRSHAAASAEPQVWPLRHTQHP
jgi:hypothetical protein